ncbi:MAG: hypothetical protein AAGA38_15765 [Pseudomonadota bacterium]
MKHSTRFEGSTVGSHIAAFLFIAFAFSACGFSPVYQEGGAASELKGTIQYAEPTSPGQFEIARYVEERLGPAAAPQFELRIFPAIRSEALGVAIGENINREDLIGTATYSLVELGTGEVLLQGNVNTFVSYSTSSANTATTRAAQRNAVSRLLKGLTDLVIIEVLASSDSLIA